MFWKKTKNISFNFKIGKFRNLYIEDGSIFNIHSSVVLREFCSIYIASRAELIINRGVFFNNYCSINCFKKIEIGEESIFGEGVKMYDHNHQYSNVDLKVEINQFTTNPIRIGSNCWIGSNVTILKGVTIGDNVIIGANCLIYKSIPSNSIVKHTSGLDIKTI